MTFGEFLRAPSTGPRLDAMLADNARVDAQIEKAGPRRCCAEFAIVTMCDGETDHMWCGICDRRFDQLCSVADMVPAVFR